MCEDNEEVPEEDQFDISKMNTHLHNLAAAATNEKDILDHLVKKHERLVEELGVLNKKLTV